MAMWLVREMDGLRTLRLVEAYSLISHRSSWPFTSLHTSSIC